MVHEAPDGLGDNNNHNTTKKKQTASTTLRSDRGVQFMEPKRLLRERVRNTGTTDWVQEDHLLARSALGEKAPKIYYEAQRRVLKLTIPTLPG